MTVNNTKAHSRTVSVVASHQFEIRIAVLGYVSAGKTTVINALLRDKYGQVGMKRATAGVNCFRLHQRHHRTHHRKKKAKKNGGGAGSDDEEEEDDEGELTCVAAEDTLREISYDNKVLRESTAVNVKWFDVYMSRRSLCPNDDMRPDTRLVLVDIPGINEAGAGGKYRDYVRDHWDTFDCVLVVMDGRLGANTEEQVKLLEFVRDNNRNKKDVATIIVCNKVDDPEDLEQAELVKEAMEEVARIFSGRGNKKRKKNSGASSIMREPKFVATSAEFAYIYRTAAFMTFEQFRNFDKDLVDRLGRKELGRKFNKLSVDEKYRLAYEDLADKEQMPDRIQSTNFNAVLSALAESVGGSDVQLDLIQRQIDVSLRGISHDKPGFAETIRSVYSKRRAMNQSTDDLPGFFWDAFDKSVDAAFRLFAASPVSVTALSMPLQDLVAYCSFVTAEGLDDERLLCESRFKSLVSRQIGLVLSKDAIATTEWALCDASEIARWGTIHPLDWFNVLQSFLLLLHNKVFCESFGTEIMMLEAAKHKWLGAVDTEPSFGDCPKCSENPLDFNSYCTRCALFVSPINCAALSELRRSPCPLCTHWTRGSGRQNCNHSVFEVVPEAKVVGPTLFCVEEGCTDPLNPNRFCEDCHSMYCLQGSDRSTICFNCRCELDEGRCPNSCGAEVLTWKELPFGSLAELVGREYDETDGSYQPKHPESYASLVRLDVPTRLSDPCHFGHVAWRYCRFVEESQELDSP